MDNSPTIVVLSTADYDAPVWTNKQHLAAGLAHSRTITYIESLGLRRPTLRVVDLFRLGTRLRGLVGRRSVGRENTKQEPEHTGQIKILTPVLLPFHGFRTAAWVNQRLVNRFIASKLKADGDYLLWTFSPITYGLEKNAKYSVYHSVDLLHELPGVPKQAMISAEKRLLQSADVVIASSRGVNNHLETLGRGPDYLWENVASVELFTNKDVDRCERAIFAGNLTPTKVDSRLILDIADRGIDVVLAGPRSIDGLDSDAAFRELFNHPRIRYLGNLSLSDLATETSHSMVGLIPYKLNTYTEGVFPMKVYEYLAAGLEVISTPLVSLIDRPIDGLNVASGKAFASLTSSAIRNFTEQSANVRSKSAQEMSWTNRIVQANHLIDSITTNKSRT